MSLAGGGEVRGAGEPGVRALEGFELAEGGLEGVEVFGLEAFRALRGAAGEGDQGGVVAGQAGREVVRALDPALEGDEVAGGIGEELGGGGLEAGQELGVGEAADLLEGLLAGCGFGLGAGQGLAGFALGLLGAAGGIFGLGGLALGDAGALLGLAGLLLGARLVLVGAGRLTLLGLHGRDPLL